MFTLVVTVRSSLFHLFGPNAHYFWIFQSYVTCVSKYNLVTVLVTTWNTKFQHWRKPWLYNTGGQSRFTAFISEVNKMSEPGCSVYGGTEWKLCCVYIEHIYSLSTHSIFSFTEEYNMQLLQVQYLIRQTLGGLHDKLNLNIELRFWIWLLYP